MSGGSYDYLCWKECPTLEHRDSISDMVGQLDSLHLGTSQAANDLRAVNAALATLAEKWKRLTAVTQAVEWWRSADWGPEEVAEAVLAYERKADET